MVVAEPSESLAAELRRLLPDLRQVAGDGRRVHRCFCGACGWCGDIVLADRIVGHEAAE
jgi:hypothetical protein